MKPRWIDRALKGTALVAVTGLCAFVYASSSTSAFNAASSRVAALNHGRSAGLTPSAHGAGGQSAEASTPGLSGGSIFAPTSGRSATLAATTPPPTSSTIGLWAADWGGAAAKRSTAGWQAAAKNDSILIGDAGRYSKMIPQLHAWNPNLTVLIYQLGPYLQKGSSNYNSILSAHPTWFAHDKSGRLINLHMFQSNYLMDEGNASYRAWQAQQVAAAVSVGGFDGAMIDSVGDAPVGGGHYSSGVPVNQVTHQPYTAAQYLANSVLLLNADKAAIGTKFLLFNGLISGPEYARATHILATSNANGGVSELFLRQPTGSISAFPNATTVQESIAMMTALGAAGKAFLGWTKVWVNGSSAQVAKWEQFTLGVYLLGRQSMSYLDFMPSHSSDNTAVSYSNLTSNLGAPLGAYTVSGSTYTRSFQHGTVTVNVSTGTAVI